MPVIITKNSSSAGAVPSAGQLVRGELAVNVTDRKLYTLNASNAVVLLSSGEITLTTTGTSGAATLVSNALNIPIYGNGTVTSLSVASANGFAGTVFDWYA
jgi:pseudouridine-5'-phosphate glycosidase